MALFVYSGKLCESLEVPACDAAGVPIERSIRGALYFRPGTMRLTGTEAAYVLTVRPDIWASLRLCVPRKPEATPVVAPEPEAKPEPEPEMELEPKAVSDGAGVLDAGPGRPSESRKLRSARRRNRR